MESFEVVGRKAFDADLNKVGSTPDKKGNRDNLGIISHISP